MDIKQKFSEYKSLFLLGISGLSLLAFLKVLDSVIEKESVVKIDLIITNWIYTIRTPFLNTLMKIITDLANVESIIVFLLIVFGVLLVLKKQRYILAMLVSSVTSYAFVAIIKELIKRPRPAIANALAVETSFSFPSGHTMIAVAVYGLLFYFLMRISKPKWLKILLSIAGTLVVLAIGFSRIYLGVHWSSDVFASLLLGISWLSLLIWYLERKKVLKRLP